MAGRDSSDRLIRSGGDRLSTGDGKKAASGFTFLQMRTRRPVQVHRKGAAESLAARRQMRFQAEWTQCFVSVSKRDGDIRHIALPSSGATRAAELGGSWRPSEPAGSKADARPVCARRQDILVATHASPSGMR